MLHYIHFIVVFMLETKDKDNPESSQRIRHTTLDKQKSHSCFSGGKYGSQKMMEWCQQSIKGNTCWHRFILPVKISSGKKMK